MQPFIVYDAVVHNDGQRNSKSPEPCLPGCQRDVPGVRVHVLEAGHFALDTKEDAIAVSVSSFIETLR